MRTLGAGIHWTIRQTLELYFTTGLTLCVVLSRPLVGLCVLGRARRQVQTNEEACDARRNCVFPPPPPSSSSHPLAPHPPQTLHLFQRQDLKAV